MCIASPPALEFLPLTFRFWMMTLLRPLMLMPPLIVTFVPTPIKVLLELTLSSPMLSALVAVIRMICRVLLEAAALSSEAVSTSTVVPP